MKRTDISSLDDLRAFVMVANLGSIRAAADALSLTHGAVSRRVSKFAHGLGIGLLEPDGRGVRPTPEGELLAEAATKGFALIANALETIRSSTKPAPIILSCERSLAMRWLIPRLSGFQDAYPDIEVHLATGGGTLDFAKDRITLAIRRLDFPVDPDWMVEPLMPEYMGPVATDAMQVRFNAGDYVALGSRTRPHAWRDWLDAHPTVARPRTTQLLDHHFLMIEAAIGGLGVALCSRAMAIDDVKAGRLTAPQGFEQDGTGYALIRSRGIALTDQSRALHDWLITQTPY